MDTKMKLKRAECCLYVQIQKLSIYGSQENLPKWVSGTYSKATGNGT